MKNRVRILFCVLTILSVLYIFSNSLSGASQVEEKKRYVVAAVENVVETVTGKEISLDSLARGATLAKIGHVLEFSVFSILFSITVYLFCSALNWDSFYRIMFVCSFVALTDEHLQTMGNGRNSSVTDVMIDLSACMMGYAVSVGIAAILKRRNEKRERNLFDT